MNHSNPVATLNKTLSERAAWILASAILLLAFGLRLYNLGEWPVEQDELYTLHDAQAVGDYINYLRPFYYLLQRVLLEVFPATPLFLRIPPFLFGVLGVWITWELGRRSFGITAGLVASFLAAISAWHLYASQFARYWSLIYALAGLLYIVVPRAIDTNRTSAYVLALATILVGTLTHPTFAFPALGFILALFLVSRDGKVGWTWPSRRAWLLLWGPLAAVATAGIFFLWLSRSFDALSGSRGLVAALRLLPAMVQWASPAVVAASAIGMIALLAWSTNTDRRWGACAILGCVSSVGLLLLAATSRSVYADYGMAMLPLVFVSVGGLVQRLAEKLTDWSRGFALAATLTLAAGMLPGTVSHLSDGTRFDYRPAYSYIERVGGNHLVLSWPETVQRYYAPNLRAQRLETDTSFLDMTLQRTDGFWLVGSYRRYGMARDDGSAARWIDAHCRKVMQTERARLDYRTYRVELHWCGSRPRPG